MSNSTPALADGQARATEKAVCAIFGGGVLPASRPRRTLPEPAPNGKWSVYKLYDAEDLLLYIGLSKCVGARFASHEADKEWWTRVAEVRIDRYASLEDARHVERRAICWLHPLFNKQHNFFRLRDPDVPPVKRVKVAQ